MELETQDKDISKPRLDDEDKDVEASNKKIPYPKSVFFICINELCERFSYYGMRAILSIYLKNVLGYSENTATMIYHLFIVFCYLTPVFGSMLADSLLGKFRTITYLSIVYAAGQALLSAAAAPPLKLPDETFSMLGLALIAIGTGGIKPCVSSFGADQFKMPEQEKQIGSYFWIFYMCINAGSLISTFITPELREGVQCFDQDTCYSLAFGVPAVLMVVSLVVFLIGNFFGYKKVKPSGNLFLKVFKTVFHALGRKRKLKEKRDHWMDYADDICSQREINELKILMQVLWLYIPLPIFWALYDQQGSRWTFQATRMDGDIGFTVIKPDQMQVVNAFMILFFVPLFEYVVYPVLAKCRLLTKPLQRLTAGGILIGVAFVVSGLVELKLETTYPVKIKDGQSYLQVINRDTQAFNGSLMLNGTVTMDFNVDVNSDWKPEEAFEEGLYTLKINGIDLSNRLNLTSEKASTVVVVRNEATQALELVYPRDANETAEFSSFAQVEKSEEALPYFRIIQYNVWENCTGAACAANNETIFHLLGEKEDYEFAYDTNQSRYSDYQSTVVKEVEVGEYTLNYTTTSGNVTVGEFELQTGGSYVYTIVKLSNGTLVGQLHTVTEPNSVHMLWLLPQYVILTAAEVMFSVTIMDFSYAEAPTSMKSVLQACWLLTVAFGNVIIAIVAESEIFESQWQEFFLFAGLMFVDMAIFAYMAYLYKPANPEDKGHLDDKDAGDENTKKLGETNEGFSKENDDSD